MNVSREMGNVTWEECVFPVTVEFWLSFVITGSFLLAGLYLQLFIVTVNIIDFMKRRSLMAADQIITSLAIARILNLTGCPLNYLSRCVSEDLRSILSLVCMFSSFPPWFTETWLSTLLSAFFCFKISTFHNFFFLRLKTFISQRVTSLIVASVLLGFGYTLIYVCYFHKTLLMTYYKITNAIQKDQLSFSFVFYWNLFPFLLSFSTSVLLMVFLGYHVCQLKTQRKVIGSVDTYHKIIIFTAVSSLTCALSGLANVIDSNTKSSLRLLWIYVFWNVFPFLHSLSLVYVTAKLRNQFFKVVYRGRDWLFGGKAPEADRSVTVEVTNL